MRRPRLEKVRTRRSRGLCIVMVCGDFAEAAEVARRLLQVNTGSLVTYRRAEDLLMNTPAGRVALIILADGSDPRKVDGTLKWIRQRWARCPVVLVGDEGGGEMEMAARVNGASYLTRPVSSQQWAAMIEHAMSSERWVASEETLG